MSDPNFHITSPRLYISHHIPSNDAHCDLMVSLLRSPASLKHNPSGPAAIPNREAARTYLASMADRMTTTGYGRYLISLRPSSPSTSSPESQDKKEEQENDSTPFSSRPLEHIGVVTCQLSRHPIPSPLIPDIGFNFLPQYHGRGYAREAAERLMQYMRNEKGHKQFAGLTDDGNEGAKRVLVKLGFEDRGLRGVRGMDREGGVMELSVWTYGVGGEEELKDLGL
jgi:RimJ/RimL family protein N-acetyltransferase